MGIPRFLCRVLHPKRNRLAYYRYVSTTQVSYIQLSSCEKLSPWRGHDAVASMFGFNMNP